MSRIAGNAAAGVVALFLTAGAVTPQASFTLPVEPPQHPPAPSVELLPAPGMPSPEGWNHRTTEEVLLAGAATDFLWAILETLLDPDLDNDASRFDADTDADRASRDAEDDADRVVIDNDRDHDRRVLDLELDSERDHNDG